MERICVLRQHCVGVWVHPFGKDRFEGAILLQWYGILITGDIIMINATLINEVINKMLTVAELQSLIRRLDEGPADELESETLEFKSWQSGGQAYKGQLPEIRQAVVAFANARGGLLVLGVADGKKSRAEAIHGVGSLDENRVRRSIYDGTDPHILVEIEPLSEPEGRLLVIRVPAGMPPHTTTDGVAPDSGREGEQAFDWSESCPISGIPWSA